MSLDSLLNPHSGYVKLESYLLEFLSHVTSNVKFLHMFCSLSITKARVPTLVSVEASWYDQDLRKLQGKLK